MSIVALKHTDGRTICLQWSMQSFIVAYPISWKQHEESFFSGIIRQPQTKTFFHLLLFNYVWLFMSFQAAEKALKAMQYIMWTQTRRRTTTICVKIAMILMTMDYPSQRVNWKVLQLILHTCDILTLCHTPRYQMTCIQQKRQRRPWTQQETFWRE